ncbi:long-chain fatty acid--CoA ligase [Sphingomonas sp. R86521]|uniref:long-chain fatty acid--CoA ligase n=1 Tax=Sphingomonas sp. R86521 TaxID=3093860 RepID=UPI0036D32DD4
MLGLMQQQQLTTGSLIDHAARAHGRTEIVSRRPDGQLERSTWAEVGARSRKVATMLATLGAEPGDRIATLAWNRLPHLELYYGVTAAGMVLHTVNPRLFADQIRYIVDHGGAKILCIDPDLLPILEPVIADLPRIEAIIVLSAGSDMPDSQIPGLIAYHDLVAAAEPLAQWPALDESTASSLCYTSGTTGNPKGVLYSHRSTVLHAYAACAADSMALSARDTVLLAPPLFHVNAWGLPFTSAMVGAKLVMPGSAMDGASIHQLLHDEGVTFSLGVPTLWFTVLDYIARNVSETDRAALKLNRVFMGGAATPRALIELFRDLLGTKANQAWGMTETSPVSTVCQPLASQIHLTGNALTDVLATQGRAVFGIELRIENAAGDALPHDGAESGLLKVRGPWVLSAYYGNPADADVDAKGWLDTGDVAKIDADGFLHLTDRAKDVIKSGGEWISSIDLENAATAHPAVAEAAVIGVPHPRWQERPLLLLRLHPGESVEKPAMLDHLAGHVAKWWLPDDVLVVDDLPHTATGKLLKTELRARYREHLGGIG